jgi:outer membrane receptor for ferrienterochelin and colicins
MISVRLGRKSGRRRGTATDTEDRQLKPVDAVLRLKRLEVTGATQRRGRLEDAPASTTIITAEELRLFGYRTVAEALRFVRSLQVWTDRLYDSAGRCGSACPPPSEGPPAQARTRLDS